MTMIDHPNSLAIAAAFVAMSGVGFLARAALVDAPQGASEEQRRVAANRKAFNVALGAPVLFLGFLLHAVSHLASPPLNAAVTMAMLLLAFCLLLYACLEDMLVEGVTGSDIVRLPAPKLHLLPPSSPPPEVREPLVASPRTIEVTVAS